MKNYLAALALTVALTACTTTGGLATKGKPVDPAVTFKHVCDGAKIADGLFQTIASASGGKISTADVSLEHDVYAGVAVICSGPVPADLNGALLAIIADSTQIGTLVSKYTNKPAA